MCVVYNEDLNVQSMALKTVFNPRHKCCGAGVAHVDLETYNK